MINVKSKKEIKKENFVKKGVRKFFLNPIRVIFPFAFKRRLRIHPLDVKTEN